MFSGLLNEMYQEFRKVWQCSERYKVKGVMGYANRHVEEETLIRHV